MDKAHGKQFNKEGVAKDHPTSLQKFKTAMSWIGPALLDVIPGMQEVGVGLTAGRLAAQGIAQGAKAGIKAGAKAGAKAVEKKGAKEAAKDAAKKAGKAGKDQAKDAAKDQAQQQAQGNQQPDVNYKAETDQQKQAAQDHRAFFSFGCVMLEANAGS